jgi:predicted amidohydrolase YtcJ
MPDITADLILHNANILTLDPKLPAAKMVAVKKGIIIGIGEDNEISSFKASSTKMIDGHGLPVIPGFNDSHCHPISFAMSLVYVDCSPEKVNNIEDIVQKIRHCGESTPEGEWIRAAGYNELQLTEKRHPTFRDLDRAAPANPTILIKDTGKTCVLNSLALKIIGISVETPNPKAGFIERDPKSRIPTGVLSGLIDEMRMKLPPVTQSELRQGIKLADQFYLENGITSIQDVTWSNSLRHWDYYQELKREGRFSPRVAVMAGSDNVDEFKKHGLSTGSGNSMLKLSSAKIALDESTGCEHPPQAELNRHALRAHRAGFQIALHVSDVQALLTALETLRYVTDNDPAPVKRPRLEHCSACPPDLMPELKSLNVTVVTQPFFLYTMGEQFLKEVETRQLNWLFPLKTLIRNSVKTAISSDSPLLPACPFKGIYTAVARKEKFGKSITTEESISTLDALKMYSSVPAWTTFDEKTKGTLTPGKVADLAVLSDDPTKTEPDKIMDIKVVKTIIGGKIAWET